MDASNFDSALNHTRRSDASEKNKKILVSTFERFHLWTTLESSPVSVKIFTYERFFETSKLIFRDTFACNCNEGFTGDGTACTALQNECELNTHTCHEDAFCGDTDEGFSCTCNEGFTGDGFSGVDNTGRAHFNPFLLYLNEKIVMLFFFIL